MNMPVVEVAIGLALVYLMMAILCSGALEVISGFFDLRGEMLWKGVESMLGGRGAGDGAISRIAGLARAMRSNFVSGAPSPQAPQAGGQVLQLSRALVAHPVVDSLRNGKRAPSYMPAQAFAAALVDTLGQSYREGHRLYADFSATVRAIPDGPLRRNLELILQETGGDAAQVKLAIEKWYDQVMQRVSGWYKRQAQWLLLALAVLASVSLNVDSIELAKRMWRDPMLRAVAVKSAENAVAAKSPESAVAAKKRMEVAKQEIDALGAGGMPIGWPAPWMEESVKGQDFWAGVLSSIVGWLITALAVSLGAPYWYELLMKLLPLARSSGGKPSQTEPQAPKPAQAGAPADQPPVQPVGSAPASPPAAASQDAVNAYEATLMRDDVVEMQEVLGVPVTGYLDQATRVAIREAQKKAGLTPSGELNAQFVGELLRAKRAR